MRFVFIHAHRQHLAGHGDVPGAGGVEGGYYGWRARPLCDRVKDDRVLAEKIRAIQPQVKPRYGSPRVRMRAARAGRPVREAPGRAADARGRARGQDRAELPPRDDALAARRSGGAERGGPAVLARSNPEPDRTWAADITYIPTREGWLYLAVMLDLASRRVVGWAVRTALEQELTLAALQMALRHRGARGGRHHSDRGVQYAARAYQRLLASAGFTASMSRKATAGTTPSSRASSRR